MSHDLPDSAERRDYIVHTLNSFLSEDVWRPEGSNIGGRGEHLTISLLSLNRVPLSKRLCLSIVEHLPEFKGEVLVIDNGSDAAELDVLEAFLKEMPFRWRLLKLARNYGVAGGRNNAAENCETPWLAFLDNDIYFINNPIPRIQKDIAELGCNFINLPLLQPDRKRIFARGGLMYIALDESGAVTVSSGSAGLQNETIEYDGRGFLSTFLYGGTSIVHVPTFLRAGAFDSAMMVGYEDVDFSIRLFRSGYKVGTCGAVALVHDHPAPESEPDRDYVRKRLSTDLVKQSARHMEGKYGYRFWDDSVSDWLRSQSERLGSHYSEAAEIAGSVQERPRLPRIALVVDTDNWAFANIAEQIETRLGHRYEIETIAVSSVNDNVVRMVMLLGGFDLIHFLWRDYLRILEFPSTHAYAESLGHDLASLRKRYFGNAAISTGVHDHLFLTEDEIRENTSVFRKVAGYCVISRKLFDVYSKIACYPKPSAILYDAVDLSKFKPRNLDRFKALSDGRPLVIGWAGNSLWGADFNNDPKGTLLIREVLDQLRAEGVAVEQRFADRQTRFIPHDEMPAYYGEIDILLCASAMEGTPSPVLEAMACGVPVITTDVGIVREALGPLQSEFVLETRSVDALKRAILRLHVQRDLFPKLSEENLRMIGPWDWSRKVLDYAAFFDAMLETRERQGRNGPA